MVAFWRLERGDGINRRANLRSAFCWTIALLGLIVLASTGSDWDGEKGARIVGAAEDRAIERAHVGRFPPGRARADDR